VTVQALKRRFDELVLQLDDVEKTTWKDANGSHYVDNELHVGWRVKVRNLLSQACGRESEHYRQFVQIEEERIPFFTNHDRMKLLRAVFLAAKEDYEGGYLRSIRSLVHAELFDDELEQARELLASGYTVAAAIARVVLETTLRTLCVDNGIPVKTPDGKSVKLDRMNADLAKAGAYNTMVQKQILWLEDIGNKAAHGDIAGFKDADASDMIAQTERFVRDHT
jgi:hypothetical protein